MNFETACHVPFLRSSFTTSTTVRITDTYLNVRFTSETYDHEEQDRNDVVIEAGPVVDFEGCDEGTDQHEENRTRS